MGAGTSGRLVPRCLRMPSTFGVSGRNGYRSVAGGPEAILKAKEGAEDSLTLGTEDLKAIQFTEKDVVVGIAASGRTLRDWCTQYAIRLAR